MNINLMPAENVVERYSFSLMTVAITVFGVLTIAFTILGRIQFLTASSGAMLQTELRAELAQEQSKLSVLQSKLPGAAAASTTLGAMLDSQVDIRQIFVNIESAAPSGVHVSQLSLAGGNVTAQCSAPTLSAISKYLTTLQQIPQASRAWVNTTSSNGAQVNFDVVLTLRTGGSR